MNVKKRILFEYFKDYYPEYFKYIDNNSIKYITFNNEFINFQLEFMPNDEIVSFYLTIKEYENYKKYYLRKDKLKKILNDKS